MNSDSGYRIDVHLLDEDEFGSPEYYRDLQQHWSAFTRCLGGLCHVTILRSGFVDTKDGAPEGAKIPEVDFQAAVDAVSLLEVPNTLKQTLYYL